MLLRPQGAGGFSLGAFAAVSAVALSSLTHGFGAFPPTEPSQPEPQPAIRSERAYPPPTLIRFEPAAERRSPQEAFLNAIAPAAQASQRSTGVPAAVTMAQAILESGWGESRLAREGNNYFGVKSHGREGSAGVVLMQTREVIGGRSVMLRESFRAYASPEDSFVDHGRFLAENPRYAAALMVGHDARRFAQELARAGYATDPGYAAKLIGLMDRWDLYRFNVSEESLFDRWMA